MEKQKDDTLMRVRSYRSVLTTGFRLYAGNFRRLFKASWQMVLLYAVACGALVTLNVIKIPKMTLAIMQQLASNQGILIESLQQYGLVLLEMLALMLVAIITMALASAPILNKLKEHKETGTIIPPAHWLTSSPQLMGRTLKGVLLTLLLLLVPQLLLITLLVTAEIVSPHLITGHIITCTAFYCLASFCILMLSLPLFYVLMKYLMEAPCGYWSTLCNSYGRGMRHWGLLFLVFLVSLLFMLIVSFIITLPATILIVANQQAHTGLLMGDELGMPTYMPVLTFGTAMLCSFNQFYIMQVTLVHNYYAYGSIETWEQEKDEGNERK